MMYVVIYVSTCATSTNSYGSLLYTFYLAFLSRDRRYIVDKHDTGRHCCRGQSTVEWRPEERVAVTMHAQEGLVEWVLYLYLPAVS